MYLCIYYLFRILVSCTSKVARDIFKKMMTHMLKTKISSIDSIHIDTIAEHVQESHFTFILGRLCCQYPGLQQKCVV